jgi:MoaA/NifB/PqqE/SkfB family radical SAM enzyme
LEASFLAEMKIVYFNITFRCNHDCWFCAARVDRHAEIPLGKMKAALKRFGIGRGDYVIINGGEATLYRGLEGLLTEIRRCGARSNLYTNGALLADMAYTRRLALAGLDHVCIPLYGRTARDHDAMTCRRGAFARTCAGIDHLIMLKEEGYPIVIELKLLHCKPTYRRNPSIARWMAKRFPGTDYISVNPPLYTGRAGDHLKRFAVDLIETMHWLNESAAAVVKSGARLSVPHIPYCLLRQRLRDDRFRKTFLPYPLHWPILYFDPAHPSGVINTSCLPSLKVCRTCRYYRRCPGFNPYNLGTVSSTRSPSRAERQSRRPLQP